MRCVGGATSDMYRVERGPQNYGWRVMSRTMIGLTRWIIKLCGYKTRPGVTGDKKSQTKAFGLNEWNPGESPLSVTVVTERERNTRG